MPKLIEITATYLNERFRFANMTCARQHFAPHARPLLTVEGPQGIVARAYADGPQLMYFVWDANDLSNEDIERIERAAEVGGGRVRVWDEADNVTEYRIARGP